VLDNLDGKLDNFNGKEAIPKSNLVPKSTILSNIVVDNLQWIWLAEIWVYSQDWRKSVVALWAQLQFAIMYTMDVYSRFSHNNLTSNQTWALQNQLHNALIFLLGDYHIFSFYSTQHSIVKYQHAIYNIFIDFVSLTTM
jgi:hypothetical protein